MEGGETATYASPSLAAKCLLFIMTLEVGSPLLISYRKCPYKRQALYRRAGQTKHSLCRVTPTSLPSFLPSRTCTLHVHSWHPERKQT